MSRPEADTVRLRHMLQAAELALRFCAGRQRADLDADDMLRFALVHAVMVVGEAASKVSDATRRELADIRWPAMIGMRHRLVHAYFEIDAAVLWQSATEGMRALAARLRSALGSD
jgi:uncharacterized protein with HEPN domain